MTQGDHRCSADHFQSRVTGPEYTGIMNSRSAPIRKEQESWPKRAFLAKAILEKLEGSAGTRQVPGEILSDWM